MIRPEATGYGTVYFAQSMLETRGDSLEGKIITVSGSGNVAQFACEKSTQLGAKVVTLSDSAGYIYDPEGIDADKLAFVMDLKNNRRGRIKEYVDVYPNPSSGVFALNVTLKKGAEAEISILDVMGKELMLVSSGYITSKSFDIDMSEMPDGVYVVKIQTSEETKLERIVISK